MLPSPCACSSGPPVPLAPPHFPAHTECHWCFALACAPTEQTRLGLRLGLRLGSGRAHRPRLGAPHTESRAARLPPASPRGTSPALADSEHPRPPRPAIHKLTSLPGNGPQLREAAAASSPRGRLRWAAQRIEATFYVDVSFERWREKDSRFLCLLKRFSKDCGGRAPHARNSPLAGIFSELKSNPGTETQGNEQW